MANRKKATYTPIRGDAVDELMARHLNESPYNLPVKALGDGHYMFGNKKIFAKIMNEKLVIKAGGGFMLIDEFIKNYGDESNLSSRQHSSYVRKEGGTTTTTTTTINKTYETYNTTTGMAGRASPKRGQASPKRGQASPTGAGGSPQRRFQV